MSHPAEDGFHEIQLTGKQLVFLFMATTVVAVVIFLCGVLVGRGVSTDRAAAEAAAAGAAPDDRAAPPPGAPQQTGEPSAATAEDLSYARRLQGEDPKEQLKPGAAAEDSTAEPPTPVESTPEQPPAGTRAPANAAAASTQGSQEGARGAGGSAWVVQIAALRDRAAAIAMIRRLSTKGYQAFIVDPRPGAPAVGYRVRVGPYEDRREAEQIARRLEREEQFKPFITR